MGGIVVVRKKEASIVVCLRAQTYQRTRNNWKSFLRLAMRKVVSYFAQGGGGTES